ncbi:hypothetical protein AVEN_243804-1 [Araneus ventricosus]|uniref:Uncharacterized protein n=1 Tax=Araneus ventricosus TaxID=182803 RepID=A0A4Y2A6K2_ARAVE|nr:hypothetical protein AVEN_243804-1 [Araneus ventricosus]
MRDLQRFLMVSQPVNTDFRDKMKVLENGRIMALTLLRTEIWRIPCDAQDGWKTAAPKKKATSKTVPPSKKVVKPVALSVPKIGVPARTDPVLPASSQVASTKSSSGPSGASPPGPGTATNSAYVSKCSPSTRATSSASTLPPPSMPAVPTTSRLTPPPLNLTLTAPDSGRNDPPPTNNDGRPTTPLNDDSALELSSHIETPETCSIMVADSHGRIVQTHPAASDNDADSEESIDDDGTNPLSPVSGVCPNDNCRKSLTCISFFPFKSPCTTLKTDATRTSKGKPVILLLASTTTRRCTEEPKHRKMNLDAKSLELLEDHGETETGTEDVAKTPILLTMMPLMTPLSLSQPLFYRMRILRRLRKTRLCYPTFVGNLNPSGRMTLRKETSSHFAHWLSRQCKKPRTTSLKRTKVVLKVSRPGVNVIQRILFSSSGTSLGTGNVLSD